MRKTLRPATTALALICAAALAGCAKQEAALGPACAPADAAAFAASPYKVKPNARFVYAETTFGRALGNAGCEDRRMGFLGTSKYAVCDFTGPAVLEYELAGQHSYFTPGVGRPVRVVIKDGAATCEMPAR